MLGSDRNRVLCPPRFCADWSVSALSFSSLASSLVRIAGIQLGYCPTWPLRTVDFLRACSQAFLLGFSSTGKKYFVWPVGIHRRNDPSEPLRQAGIGVRPLSSCFYGLRDMGVGQRARSLFSVGCAYLKLKYRGGICSALAPASLHPYLVSSRLCETRRSATNLGCVPFPSNSQEPLNETL